MFGRFIYFFLFLNCSLLLHSQDIGLYRNYLFNNFYNFNPAAAGYDGSIISQITISKKWVGINGSPSNQVFSNSIRLGEEEFYDRNRFINRPIINLAPRVGLGFTVYNETSGPMRHTGLLFAYAYHISVRENRISLGLSGLISQYHLDTKEFKPINPDDPDLYTSTSEIVPDINFGALYYNKRFFAGISALGLVNFNKVMDHTKTFPDIVVCGGYKFKINKSYKFEPSIFIWRYGDGTFSTDINCKLYYNDLNWILLSYQGNGEILAGIGLSINSYFQICYYYAINTNGMASYNLGNQSISLKADLAAYVRKHR
jgi:type IX secretion system PorP/SprF family membrane protein